MAKKRKKRPAPRPTAPVEQGPARQEKKEAARKEREARVRAARRRVLMRRLSRVGILLLVIGGITAAVFLFRANKNKELETFDAAAARIGCGEIQDFSYDAEEPHLAPGEPPPTYSTQPATFGKHNGTPLPGDLHTYTQPFDADLEAQAVHNLEHAYVLIYYRQSGEGALPEGVVTALENLAEKENKVIIAPYANLPAGQQLALAAWTRLQTCTKVTAAGDAVQTAKGFIKRFRGGGAAPEPTAP